MTPKEFIAQHIIAVDYNNGVSVSMVSVNNAHKAVELAEYNLAKELLNLTESSRIEALERIVKNQANYSIN